MAQLPGQAGEIEEVIGLDAAIALIKARGGLTIEVPSSRAENTALARIVGVEACQQMIDYYGPGRLPIPMAGIVGRAARDRALKARAMKMIDEGASNAQIVLACGLSRRTVQNYRRESERGGDSDQLSLF
ncbi:MAG: hypothetical protein CSA85_00120 [Alphaproteobacteria bacterium]|nr:MAG: hypothetical protein CSA85_00120 [Alphaproteobacteria bacterium]